MPSSHQEVAGEVDAGLVAEGDVDDDHVGLVTADHLEAGVAVAGGRDDLAALAVQQQLQPLAQGRVVFDQCEPDRGHHDLIGTGAAHL